MSQRRVVLVACLVLCAVTPVRAEKSSFADEVFDLWSEAYVQDGRSAAQTSPVATRPTRSAPNGANEAGARSLTPHLDQLLGSPVRGTGSSRGPRARSVDHGLLFENPPMAPQSKGSYSGSYSHDRDRDRDHDGDGYDSSQCGHGGDCRCGGTSPVPEPGTLLLAGMAGMTAWGARRRARRRADPDTSK